MFKMLRSIGSILAGWGAVGVLVVLTDGVLGKLFPAAYIPGVKPPDHLMLVSLVTGTLYSVLGGWITARLAAEKHWAHVGSLIAWGEVMGVTSMAFTLGQVQFWYQASLLVTWPLAVLLGGWLRLRQL